MQRHCFERGEWVCRLAAAVVVALVSVASSVELFGAEQTLVLSLKSPKEFELPYPIGDVFQIDQKLIAVQFAKKTTLLRIEGLSFCETALVVWDAYGEYHTIPVKVVSSSALRAYDWLRQNFSRVPGLRIAIESNHARASGEIFSRRVQKQLQTSARSIGFVFDVRLHPSVYKVLNIAPEPIPQPRPQFPAEGKYVPSEFSTSTTYPGRSASVSEDIPFSSYLIQVRDTVASSWREVLERVGRPQSSADVTVKFQINYDGRVSYAIIEKASGFSSFDSIALDAVGAASPLEPLPENLDSKVLNVHYRFSYKGMEASEQKP